MIEKLECTCIEAYTTRKMRDPNCCACSCDHNDLVEQLAKANERVKEFEGAVLDLCSNYHFEPDLSQPANSLKELLRINSKWSLEPEISSDAAKFAIEKKIEAAKPAFIAGYQYAIKPVIGVHSYNQILKRAESYTEQLRKEQE